MRVLYVSRKAADQTATNPAGPQCVELGQLLAESDFVSIHVPLTESTRHMVGEDQLASMKPTAIIINTARGAVIDQAALTTALEKGRIAGAGLDVTETEPIDPNDPLLKLPSVVITPHIGSATLATRLRMAELAVDNLLDVFAGHLPRCCANPNVKLRGTDSS